MGSEVQGMVRAAKIAALKKTISELERERRRLLGAVATAPLDPESHATADALLRALRDRLSTESDKLFDLENGLD